MIEPAARRHDVDWLRVGATYLLFVFHVAKVFDPSPFYHIRNAEVWSGMPVLTGFIHLWHMPLFFVLAGWAAFGSIRARGAGGFLVERVQRLLVPLLAGSAIFGPAIKYLELSSGLDASVRGLAAASPFDESFAHFLPTFFTELHRFTWAHLWFLAYLFTFSLLYWPLFAWLRGGETRTRPVAAGWVYFPVLPLAAIQVTLRPYWPGLQNLYDDWANFAMYSVYLIAGFLIARSPGFEAAVHREWRRALAVALAAIAFLVGGLAGLVSSRPAVLAATAVAGWCFIVGLLGFARRHLAFTHRALPWLAESALPVYVLHQAAIVIPGYWIIRLPLGVGAKMALLLVVSVALTLATYELVVRRFALTRFLFGMRPLAERRGAWRAEPRAAA